MPWLGYACGACDYCVSGWETLCWQQQNTGYSIDGTFGEYAVAYGARRQGARRHRPVRRRAADVRRRHHLQGGQGRRARARRTSSRCSASADSGHLAIQYAEIAGGPVVAVDITRTSSRWPASSAPSSPSTPPPRIRSRRSRSSAAPTRRSRSRSPRRRSSRPSPRCAAAARSCWSGCRPTTSHAADLRDRLNGITVIGSIVGTRVDLREVFELHAAGRTHGHPRDARARPTSTRRSPTSRPGAWPPASCSSPDMLARARRPATGSVDEHVCA